MENREHAEQAAVEWLARRETGPWGDKDAVAFEEWLAGSPTRQVAYYRFKKTWQEAGRLEALGSGPLSNRTLSAAFDVLDAPTALKTKGTKAWYALVACLVLSVAAALFMSKGIFGLDSYTTAVGGLTAVPMADGSRVTLNTDSKLRISLNGHERRIDLERGEAFFEVVKDPSRPFIVAAGEKRIIAVGTRFSVRRQGDNIRVSVTEGAVRFLTSPVPMATERPQGVLLAAGAVARAESEGVRVQERPIAEIEQALTWRTGVLTFRNTPLVDAVAEFNRYNERKIFIEDPAIAAIEVGGVFRSTDLDPFVRLIEDGLALRVSQNGNRIFLSWR